jgi:hypothetical protein
MTRRYQVKVKGKPVFSLICTDDIADAEKSCSDIFGDRLEWIKPAYFKTA